MILRIEHLEINLKDVIKAVVLTGIGVGLFRTVYNARRHATVIILDAKKKEQKLSKKNDKVESK